MKKILYLMVLAILACQPTKKNNGDITEAHGKAFKDMLEDYHKERIALYPIEALSEGNMDYNDTLPNSLTQEFRELERSFFSKYKNALSQYDKKCLSKDDQISYDVLAWECDMGLDKLALHEELLPVNQIFSLHLFMGQLGSGSGMQPFKTVADYQNWLSRLEDFTQWTDTAIANMRKGASLGITLPKALTIKIIPQFKDFSKLPVEENLFYAPIKNFPEEIGKNDRDTLTTAYKSLLSNAVVPCFQRMATYLENEYLPACRESSGIGALPNGKQAYDYYIKYYTTTEMTADEIFELGKKEVDRISKEMEQVMEEVGFKGGLLAFFDHVRNNSKLMPFNDPKEVIGNFESIYNTIKPNLDKIFDKTPMTPFEIRRTEAFREKSASAEYNPGSIEANRPGIFYVPIPDIKKYNFYSDEDLFLHEAIPGHHFQISLQQENKGLPSFRRNLWYSAYGEGWALYSESLGKELGLFTDPYQYFGMLSAEMHRAIRLVVDVGMHAKGWTREQAIQYSLEHEAESEANVIAEIERYMCAPGQALSYKIGQLKILELRAKAKQELGNKFNIKEFHNIVLGIGCVPLRILENEIDAWIAKEKEA